MGSENQMGMWLDVSKLKIWTTEQGVFARLTHGDIWAQYGPEGAGASWMPGS